MNLEEGLLTRRSVRKFQKNSKLSKQDLDDALNMAMHAPSAMNKQPWEFIVVDDGGMFNKIIAIHPHCSFLKDAGAAIIVCGNLNDQMGEGYWVADCAAATENLLLGLHAKGLGGCWCGIYPNEDRIKAFKKLFGMPEHIEPLALVVAGYPDGEAKQPQNRFRKEKIHTNHW